jgi:hypothetical protein
MILSNVELFRAMDDGRLVIRIEFDPICCGMSECWGQNDIGDVDTITPAWLMVWCAWCYRHWELYQECERLKAELDAMKAAPTTQFCSRRTAYERINS